MPSDLFGAGAKFEFIMVRISDKPHLIWYKSVEKDKILFATYTLLRLMCPILGNWKNIMQLFILLLLWLGLLKLQHIFALINDDEYLFEIKAVKRLTHANDAHNFIRSIEFSDNQSKKYVILDCSANTAKSIIVHHVRDIYMGRRNFHFFLTSLVSASYLCQYNYTHNCLVILVYHVFISQ